MTGLPYKASSFASGGGIIVSGDSSVLTTIDYNSGASWFLSPNTTTLTGTKYYQNDTDGEYMRMTGTICYMTS